MGDVCGMRGGRWEGAKTLTDFDLWPVFSSARYEMQWQHSGVEHVACVSFVCVCVCAAATQRC